MPFDSASASNMELSGIFLRDFLDFTVPSKQEGMAEREGFEPPLELPPELISSQPPSASRPSLQSGINHRFLKDIIT